MLVIPDAHAASHGTHKILSTRKKRIRLLILAARSSRVPSSSPFPERDSCRVWLRLCKTSDDLLLPYVLRGVTVVVSLGEEILHISSCQSCQRPARYRSSTLESDTRDSTTSSTGRAVPVSLAGNPTNMADANTWHPPSSCNSGAGLRANRPLIGRNVGPPRAIRARSRTGIADWLRTAGIEHPRTIQKAGCRRFGSQAQTYQLTVLSRTHDHEPQNPKHRVRGCSMAR